MAHEADEGPGFFGSLSSGLGLDPTGGAAGAAGGLVAALGQSFLAKEAAKTAAKAAENELKNRAMETRQADQELLKQLLVQQRTSGPAPIPASGGLPRWALWAGLGLGALVVVFAVLKR